MSDFDIDGARKAGYSDTEIADHLAKSRGFDAAGARKSGYTDADILTHLGGGAASKAASGGPSAGGVQDYEPRQYTEGEKAARKVGQGAQGFNDTVADYAGAPVDAIAWGARKLGVPVNDPVGGSASIKKGLDYVATLPGRISDAVSNRSLDPLSEDRTARFDAVTTGEKAAHGVGSGVANALGIMVPAAAIANTARAGTTTQGVANVLRTQPVTQAVSAGVGGAVGEATDNPWLGLAAGLAVPVAASVGRGAISPVTNRLASQERNLVAAADREGIALTPAQRTGSTTLQTVERTMASMPLASGPMQGAFNEQRGQFNAAALKRAGVTATDASPATLETAFKQAGQTFDDLAARTTVKADGKFVSDVAATANDYGRRLPTDIAPVFKSYMEDLAPLLQAAGTPGANPQLAGDVYQNIRSSLSKRIRTSKDPDLREALGGLVEALDGAVERSTSGALREEWQTARREYQALMTVDKAMQGGTQTDRAAANIPFGALKGAVAQGDRGGFSRGRGQLNEVARIGDYLANKVPDSGTVPRGVVANALTGGALFGGGVASGVGLPAAAAGALSPYLISKLYNSAAGRAYLTNQLAGRTNYGAQIGGAAARQAEEEATGGRNALRRRAEQR